MKSYIASLHKEYKPKTIPLPTIELFLSTIYSQRRQALSTHQRRNTLRDAAGAEPLFATGMRISELCSLPTGNVDLNDGTIPIYGKGSKEHRIKLPILSLCAFSKNIEAISRE